MRAWRGVSSTLFAESAWAATAWIALVSLEAPKPGKMRGYAGTEEISR